MNDSYEGKNGKVKVMYVRSEDNADNKPKNHPVVLKMVVVIAVTTDAVITVTTKIVIIDVVITNFLVVMTAVQVSLQGVAHHVTNRNLLAIAKVDVFLHGKRFLALLVKKQLKSMMVLQVRAKSILNSFVANA